MKWNNICQKLWISKNFHFSNHTVTFESIVLLAYNIFVGPISTAFIVAVKQCLSAMFVFLCEFHLNGINPFLAHARAHPNSELMSESYTKYYFKREKFRSSVMERRMVRQCCVGVMQSSCIHVLLCFFFFFSPIFKLRMIACRSLNCKSMHIKICLQHKR